MGQKTHPHGLRVGTYRKWNSSWYGVGTEGKNLFFYQRSVEEFLKMWMSLFTYTKMTKTKRLLLVDLKMFKEGFHQFYIFVFFYKLRTKRRSQKKKKKNLYANKWNMNKQKQDISQKNDFIINFKEWKQIKN